MIRPRRILESASATLLTIVFSACCSCPRPGMAGVPQASARSTDFALPLTREKSEELVRYLAMPVETRGTLREDLEETALGETRTRYGPLLARLAESRPLPADLREGGAWAPLFAAPVWPLAIHDARIEREALDADRLRGLYRDEFVFAFYWRRLKSSPAGNGVAWTLEPAPPDAHGAFVGLVVFPKQYAEPTAAK